MPRCCTILDSDWKRIRQKFYQFSLINCSKKYFIFWSAFYLIMCLMKSPKNFEKMTAGFLLRCQNWLRWNTPEWCIFRNKFSYFYLYYPSKGQIISKRFFSGQGFFKKWMTTRRILVKTNSFVRFLEESSAWQFAFEINWPLIVIVLTKCSLCCI